MKTILSLFLALAALSAIAATKDVLQAIADNADVANGSAEVSKKPLITPAERKKLVNYWKGRWDNCTFSKPYASNDAALKALADYSSDTATVDAIKKLISQGRVAKIYGFETDHDIACSQIWINVYTIDGYVLELWYGLGD